MSLKTDTKYAGCITYAVVTPNKDDQLQLELGIEVDRELCGDRLEDGVEQVSTTQALVWLHLDKDGNKPDTRRGIARDAIERLTNIRLADTWETPDGYQRLLPDGENTIHPELVGKEVMVKTREYGGTVYADLYFPRKRPTGFTRAKLLERLAKPY
jgi:hypothetical protein